MASLNSDSIRKAPEKPDVLVGNHDPADLVSIRIKDGVFIEGRRSGVVYRVDSALGHHWCEVARVAEYVRDEPKQDPPATDEPDTTEPAPEAITDRAMRPPPRGRRK